MPPPGPQNKFLRVRMTWLANPANSEYTSDRVCYFNNVAYSQGAYQQTIDFPPLYTQINLRIDFQSGKINGQCGIKGETPVPMSVLWRDNFIGFPVPLKWSLSDGWFITQAGQHTLLEVWV
jgi:hypothetical protein